MHSLNRRLQALEAEPLRALGSFRGILDYPSGGNPLDALQGREAGLWLLLDSRYDGPGLLGRVSPSGKRTIVYGGLQ